MSSKENKKEVIDIIPPNSFRRSFETFPKKRNWVPIFKFRRVGKRKILSLVGVLFVILILYSFINAKAQVSVVPKMEKFNSEFVINIDKDIEKVDIFTDTIPGHLLEETNSLTKSFPASGKIITAKKAEGIIRVYNNYSTLAQPLRASTRFMAASGEIFRTPTRIVVPGKKIEKGKEVPGYLDVKVVADQPGEEYNIGPTTFSIPGLVGTPLYTKFYAESFEPMKGGFRGEKSQVTKEDIQQAQDSVVNILKEEGKKVIEKKASDSNSVLLKEALFQEVQSTSSPEVGTQTDKFDFEAKTRSIALVFKKDDLEKLIEDKLPEGKKIYSDSLEFHWDPQSVDFKSGKMIVNLKFAGNIYPAIDLDSLREKILGKKVLEARKILEAMQEISKADIKVRPFWRKRLPSSQKRVKIELDLTQRVD